MSMDKIEINVIETMFVDTIDGGVFCLTFNNAFPNTESCFPMVDRSMADRLTAYLLRCIITNPSAGCKLLDHKEDH